MQINFRYLVNFVGITVGLLSFAFIGCSDGDSSSPVPEFSMPTFQKGLSLNLHQVTAESLNRSIILLDQTSQSEARATLNEILSELNQYRSKLVGEDPARPLDSQYVFSNQYVTNVRTTLGPCSLRARQSADRLNCTSSSNCRSDVKALSQWFEGHRCSSELSSIIREESHRVAGVNGKLTAEKIQLWSQSFDFNLTSAKVNLENLDVLFTPAEFKALDPVGLQFKIDQSIVERPLKTNDYDNAGSITQVLMASGSIVTESGQSLPFQLRSETSQSSRRKFDGNAGLETVSRQLRLFALETPEGNYVHTREESFDPSNIEEPQKLKIVINGVEVTPTKENEAQ